MSSGLSTRASVVLTIGALCLLSYPRLCHGQDHVLQLMEGTVIPFQECLDRVAADEHREWPTVVARLEFPSGDAPRLVNLMDEDGSAIERCVRAALAFVTVPEYPGPLQRAECDLPLTSEADLGCSAGPQGPAEPAPVAPLVESNETPVEPAAPPVESSAPPEAEATPPPTEDRAAAESSAPPEAEATRPPTEDRAAATSGPAEDAEGETETEEGDLTYDELPEDDPLHPRPNNVTLNLGGVVIGGFSLGYTRAFRHVSIGAALVIQVPLLLDGIAVHGQVELLFWPSPRPNSGFFGGIAFHVGKAYASPDHLQIVGSAVLGWRFLFTSGFNIGLGAAIGYGYILSECPGCTSAGPLITFGELDNDGNGGGLWVRAIVDVGIAF